MRQIRDRKAMKAPQIPSINVFTTHRKTNKIQNQQIVIKPDCKPIMLNINCQFDKIKSRSKFTII